MAPASPCPVPTCPHRRPCPVHGRALAREQQQRRADRPGHRWYHVQRWRHPQWGLRVQVLSANPWCVQCQQQGILEPAVDVDHIRPHEGDQDRFFDRTNLQGLCARCHGLKGRGE